MRESVCIRGSNLLRQFGHDLEKVNVVTGVKGSGKSHLSKVLLLQLIEQGAPL